MPLTSLAPSSDAYRFAKGDRLVDRDLVRHVAAVELVDRDPQRASLDDAEPVGRPALGGSGDPLVELGGACAAVSSASSRAHGSISPAYCEPISAPGEIPLVEQEERLAAGLAARGHSSSPIATSTVTSRPQLAFRAPAISSWARSPSSTSGSPRRAATASRTTRAVDVDRPPPPHPHAVDALGRANGDPEQHRIRNRDRPGLALDDESHAATMFSSASVEVE